ncbi:MAG: putative permease [Arcobacteraceae bacterium]|jgi:predicted permease
MSNFILIFLYMSIGFIFKNIKLPILNLHLKLNKFIIRLALPAMILLETPKLEFSANSMIPMYIAWVTMIASALLVYFLSKRYRFSREVTGSLMLVSVLANTTFVGIPVNTAYFGVEALPFIVLYDQLGTSFWLATYATIIVAYYGSKGAVSYVLIAKKIARFPPLIAFVLAITFSQYTYPHFFTTILEVLSFMIVPLALISVGLQLEFKLETSEVKPFVVSLVIKLIISPIIALFMCYIFGWSDLLIGKVSVIEAGMASMITAGVIASMNGLAPRLSNAIVAYGIAISMFTSWILYIIIR